MRAQGLLDDPTRRATVRSLEDLIHRMGFVQIDTINVVERAHHLTLGSRMDGYRPALLAELLEHKRTLFEHWTHDASAIPTQWFAHWRHRFERYRTRIRTNAWWRERIGKNPDALIKQVRQRIEKEGPLLSRDFEPQSNGEKPAENGWWGWKPQKAALEHLWRTGEIAVARRVGFQKVYDLTERVMPAQHLREASDTQSHVEWACRSALERLGTATPSEIAAFWNAIDLAAARTWCAAAHRASEIVQVIVESADGSKPRAAYALHDVFERIKRLRNQESATDRLRILSPFDPVLRDRKRVMRLFAFDYTFEAFVPAPKRRYGYYVLPIMQGDRLIGRLDPKFHRERGVLEIKGLWWEPHIRPTKARKRLLSDALLRLAQLIGAEEIQAPPDQGCQV